MTFILYFLFYCYYWYYCTVCLCILKYSISLIYRKSTCTIQASTCMYMLTQTFLKAQALHSLNGRLGAVAVRYRLRSHNCLSESSAQCPSYTKEPLGFWQSRSLKGWDSKWNGACGMQVCCSLNHSTALVEADDVKAPHSEPAQHHDSLSVSVDSGCVIPMCCRWSWGGSWQCEQQQEAGWGLAGGPVPCQQWLSCEFLCQRRGWGSQWSCLRKASRTTLWLSRCLQLKYALETCFQT